jgi:parvulin-like peptidyl-prolyl isomerase
MNPPRLLHRLAAAGLAALALLLPAAGAERVLAKGRNVEVTQAQLDEAFITFKATLAARGQAVPEAHRAVLERQLLDRLVMTQILLQKATEEDRKNGRERALKIIAEERAKAPSPARFEAQIRANGMTPESFEAQLIERAVVELVLERELQPQAAVTDAQVREFYDTQGAEFEAPERVRAAHILVATRDPVTNQPLAEDAVKQKRALAEQLRDRARAGEDFAQLARDHSDDPGSRANGGEYTFPRGQMVPEFEKVAFAQATNTVSDPVTTQFGFHVIKTLEKRPAEKVAFEEVKDGIRQRLVLLETQRLIPEFQRRLFTEAGVEFVKAD